MAKGNPEKDGDQKCLKILGKGDTRAIACFGQHRGKTQVSELSYRKDKPPGERIGPERRPCRYQALGMQTVNMKKSWVITSLYLSRYHLFIRSAN